MSGPLRASLVGARFAVELHAIDDRRPGGRAALCAATDVRHEVAIAAARAGKHAIETPLTGWFGDDGAPRARVLEGALRHRDAALDAVARAGGRGGLGARRGDLR